MNLSQAKQLITDIEEFYSEIEDKIAYNVSSVVNTLLSQGSGIMEAIDQIPDDAVVDEDDDIYGSIYRKLTVIHDNYLRLGSLFLPSSGIPMERFDDFVASYDQILKELFTNEINDANVFIRSLPSNIMWEFGITNSDTINYAFPSELYELQNKLNDSPGIPYNRTSSHIVCDMVLKDIEYKKDVLLEAFTKAYATFSYILLVYDKLADLTELEEMIRNTQLENKNMLKADEFQLYAVSDICENEKYLFLLLQKRERQYWPYNKEINLSLFDKNTKVFTCSYSGGENVCAKRPYLFYIASGYGRYDKTRLFTIERKRVPIRPKDKYTCHLDTDAEASLIMESKSIYKNLLHENISRSDKSLAVVENKSNLTNPHGVLGPVIILSLESLKSFVYAEKTIPYLLDPDMIVLRVDNKTKLKQLSKTINRVLKRHIDDIIKKPILNPFRCRMKLSDDDKIYILFHYPWEINKFKTKETHTFIPLEYPDTVRKKIQDNESNLERYFSEMCKNGYLNKSEGGKYECTRKLPLYCAAFFAFAVCHNHDLWVREINSDVSNRIFEYDDSGTEKYCFESIGNICSQYFERRLSLPENSIKNNKSYALRLFDHRGKEQLIQEENIRLDPEGRKCYDRASESINQRRKRLKEICDIIARVAEELE